MMGENDREQREFLAKALAVGLGAIAGGAIGGPIGAAFGAVAALLVEENLSNPKPPKPELESSSGPPQPQISNRLVVLALRSTQFREYFSHLSPGQKITEKTTCELLYRNTKYIWRGTQEKFKELKEQVEKLAAKDSDDEGTFHLVALETDEGLPGLGKNANPLERRDAFLALASKGKIIWVSPRYI